MSVVQDGPYIVVHIYTAWLTWGSVIVVALLWLFGTLLRHGPRRPGRYD